MPRLVLIAASLAWACLCARPAHAVSSSSRGWKRAVATLVQKRTLAQLFRDGVVGVVSDDPADEQVLTFGAANANSLFEIGSITKSFTGIAFAEMVKEGRLRPDDVASKFIPELAGTFAGGVTLAELAAHASGLPSVPADLPKNQNPYAAYGWSQLLGQLETFAAPPGETHPYQPRYSNIGFALLGHILSIADGLPYGDLIRKRITAPLGMASTSLVVSARDLPRFLDGHGVDLSVVPHWDWDAFAPTGAIRSSARDMLRYVRANLHPDSSTLGRAISLSQTNNWGWDSFFFSLDFPYKNGGTGGFTSGLLLDAAKGIGGIVLTDIAYQSDTLAMSLVNPTIIDREDYPVCEAVLDSFTGAYSSTDDPTIQVTVSRPKGYLIADFKGFSGLEMVGRTRLRASSATSFEVIDNADGLIELGAKFDFRSIGGIVSGFDFQVGKGNHAETMAFVKAR